MTMSLGAAVCAYVDGRKVVDLWGGWADADRTQEWKHDTIVNTYSATKGMTATCAHRLVDRGLLDVDEPVATYWPELAQAGKDSITVRMVLSHQAGLPWATVPYPPDKRFDWGTLTAVLARSAPVWEPGTRSEYHGGTFGYLVGEIVERIDGRSLDTFFRDEIAEPLGADFMIGFGPEHDHRCAEMVGPDDLIGPSSSRGWRSAADGSATGLGTADNLARVYAALARGGELDGVRVLRAETINAAIEEQAPLQPVGDDMFSVGLGYMLLWRMFPGLSTQTFGPQAWAARSGSPTRRTGSASAT